jgi:hypothetical protein
MKSAFSVAVTPAIVIAALLAAAGCGGSGSTQSGGVSSSSATSPAVTHTAPTHTVTVTSTSQARTAIGPPGCATSQLALSFAGGQGAAGTAYMNYRLTNRGSTECALLGYPGVAVLDAGGHIVQHPAARRRDPTTPVRRVILQPGRAAMFLLTSSDVIPSPGCQHAWMGTTLQVIPPNQRTSLRRPFTRQFCNLRVGPVQPT